MEYTKKAFEINQRILQAHLKTAQATAQTKVFKRACKADPKEN